MEYHPASKIFPLMEGAEFDALAEDIKANGLLEPIEKFNDMILDGRNRYRACQEAGVEPRYSTHVGDDPLGYVISENLKRRHLNESQRAMIGKRIESIPMGGDRKSDDFKAHNCALISRDDAAKMMNVSPRSIDNASVVMQQGNEDLIASIDRGRETVGGAVKEIRRRERNQAKAAIPDNLPTKTDRYEIIHTDISDETLGIGPFDWVITDPPYGPDHRDLYTCLAEFCHKNLKEGGSLICMSGQIDLVHVYARLSGWLAYHWTLCYLTPGAATALNARSVNTRWKPLLWFTKGKYAGDWPGTDDIFRSDKPDKDHHEWGQSESGMADIIERFTYPGQTICDPFCGAGTTGVVAVKTNRLFVGIDNDANAVKTTKSRLAEI